MRSCEVNACRFELLGLSGERIDAAFRNVEGIADGEEKGLQEALAAKVEWRGWTWSVKRLSDWAEFVRERAPNRLRWIRRWMASEPLPTEPGKQPDIPVVGFVQCASDVSRLHITVEYPPEETWKGLTGQDVEDHVLRRAIGDFHSEIISCSGELRD